jgi:hypothetical protein
VNLPPDTPLLDYSLSTSPAPLQASVEGSEPALGSIGIVISNGADEPIFCDAIVIAMPVGPLAQDLTSAPASIDVTASPAEQWRVASPEEGMFVIEPSQPQYGEITTDGIFVALDRIEINGQVGTFSIDLKETAHTGTDPDATREDTFELAKFPSGY